jgi:SAM-dependent methyltransferase
MMPTAVAPAAYFGQGEHEPYARALLTGSGALTLRPESAHYPAETVEFDVRNWCEDADATERSLLQGLRGPVLDIGCGPGRLLAAAQPLGLAALGIDASAEAVRQARGRGARVLEQSIFAPVPQPGHWQSVILLDGNIGIGGSVTALLGRCRQLIAPTGTLLVEVDADENIDPASCAVLEDRHGNRREAFAGARIGTAGRASRAPAAGWSVAAIQRLQGRVFCRLSPGRMPVRSIP